MADFDQAQSPRLGQPTPVEATSVRMFSGTDIPEAAWPGQIIYRTDTQGLQVYTNAGAWADVVGGAAGLLTYVGPDAPGGDLSIGDLWFDSDDGHKLYRWNGSSWVSVQDAAIAAAQAQADTALAQGVSAEVLAEQKSKTFIQTSPPTSVSIGDLWFDSDDGYKQYRAAVAGATTIASGQWESVRDADIVIGTGKNKVFYTTSAPTADNTGDLWFDTDDGYHPYVWNGSSWADARDATIAAAQGDATTALTAANGKNKVFYSTSAPTATATNDLWFDTDDGYKPYIWDGAAWVTVRDATIAAAQGDATSALSVANGKNKIFWAASAPTASATSDIWYDTSDGNKIYQWSGSAWVAAQLGTNAIANLAINSAQIAANAITTAKIVAGAVDTTQIAANAITTAKIAANAVDTAQINANAITSGLIAANAVTSTQIATDAVTSPKILAGSVIAGKIATDAVTANEIAAGAVTASELAAGSVIAGKIAADAVTATEIAAGAVTASEIAAGAVIAGKIAADAVTATEIAAGSVTTSELAANAVTAAKITAGTITSNEIASNTIVAGNIAASTITAGQMAAHTITAAQIATDTITASEIATGAITADELSALAVIAGKIDAGAVTTNTLAASAVTAAKIATGTITANEIATGTITAAKISTGTITANLLASTLVLASHIQVGSSMSLDPTTGLQISLTNGGLISLPADGSPAQFLKVILEATQLLVTDNFELRGSSNRISGSLNLSTGVDNPTVTPTVTAVDLTAETIAAAASTNNYRSLTDATTAWVTCDSSSNQILSINKTTGVATALLSPSTYTVYDVCKVGTNWYVYVVNLQGFYDLDEIRVYNSSWVLANIYSVPLFGTKQSAKVLATDGTDLFLVYYDTSTFATSTIKFAVTGPATRKNMMTNPTFEAGVGHWVLNQGNSIGTSTAQAFSGTTSMTLNTGGLTYGAVSAAFPSSTFTPSPSNLFNYGLVVSVGGTYTLSAYFRAASTTRDAKVQMLFYDGSGVNVAGGNSTVTTGGSVSSGWTRVATTATAPAGAVFMNVVVQVQPTSGTLPASETHYVDAVMVEQAGSASSYFDGNTTAAGKFYAWKFGTNASISTECTATNPVNTTGVLTDAPADLWIGSADFGGTRYVIPGSSGVMTIWDGTSTRQASQEWVAPNSERWRGISWDGTNFHVLTEKDGSPYTAQVYKMSTQTTSITYTARYSQYDSVGTTHETAWSPSTAISVGPRKYLKVQTSAPQGSGGVDEPNRIRHYIQTTSGSLWRQADVTASPWSVTYTTLPVTSGSSAVSTPDFTGLGNPGIVQTAKVTTASSVPYIQFKGDGTWRIQDLVGMVNLWAGPVNTDPPGYLICDGRSFLRTDYPELAATLGHPVGGAESLSLYYGAPTSTTFYVPNLSGRFAVGYDGTTEFSAIGISGGTKVHTHTGPDHLHAVGDHKHTISTSNNCTITGSALRDNASTTGFMNAGASTGAMDRSSETGSPNSAATLGDGLPPYLTMYYVIKY